MNTDDFKARTKKIAFCVLKSLDALPDGIADCQVPKESGPRISGRQIENHQSEI